MSLNKTRIIALFILAALMFLASGLHGSYFCVSPWAGGGPIPAEAHDANP
ncbi:MAG: hypothetical protein JO119_09590 [Acidobacteria bacterium]|nr:hypothetical protein [Acidobacteriota bacterium]